MSAWTPPDRWWCVNTNDERFCVDDENATQVVIALQTGDTFVTFMDIYGSQTTLRAELIQSVWETSAEVRENRRRLTAAIEAEVPEWERDDE